MILVAELCVNLAVAGTAPAANRSDGRSSCQLDPEFFLEGFTKIIAVKFLQEVAERRPKCRVDRRESCRTSKSSDSPR